MITTSTLVSLALIEKTENLRKPQCMLCETVFSNANLKLSKLQEHFNKHSGGDNVVGQDENLREIKETILILELPFQN